MIFLHDIGQSRIVSGFSGNITQLNFPEIGKLRLVVSCVVEDLLRARKSKPGFEFLVQKYNFTLFKIPTLRKKCTRMPLDNNLEQGYTMV